MSLGCGSLFTSYRTVLLLIWLVVALNACGFRQAPQGTAVVDEGLELYSRTASAAFAQGEYARAADLYRQTLQRAYARDDRGATQVPLRDGVAELAADGMHLVVDVRIARIGSVVICHLPLAIAQHAKLQKAGSGGEKLTHPILSDKFDPGWMSTSSLFMLSHRQSAYVHSGHVLGLPLQTLQQLVCSAVITARNECTTKG